MAHRAAKEMEDEKLIGQDRPRRGTALLPVLPPEVLQHMLSVCGSLKLVKSCRLVSKSWNWISCHVLKKLSYVVIEEGNEEGLENFKQFLLERQLELPPDFPNPFQDYRVKVGPAISANISRFIRYPNVRVALLDLTLAPTMSAAEFSTLLGWCKPFLKGLSIRDCCEGSKALISSELTHGWSSLTTLSFRDRNNPNVSLLFIRFIQVLIRDNPSLRKLTLRAGLENVRKVLVTRANTELANLSALTVSVEISLDDTSTNSDCLKEMSTLNLPNLKQFKLYALTFPQPLIHELQQMVLAVIGRMGQSLELLKSNCLNLHQILPFSNLGTLFCSFDEDDKFEFVNAKKFPRLTNLQVLPILTEIPDFWDARCRKPNVLVSSLGVVYAREYENPGTAAIWSTLGRHCPAITQISVSFHSQESKDFSYDVLQAIAKWFPRLQSLDFSSVTETYVLEITDLELFTQKGWPLQEVDTGGDLILAFKKLATLKLSGKVKLDRDFIKYGLSQMKSLRSLSFPWDEESYYPSDIPEYLGPLTELKSIVITCKLRTIMKELTKLAEATSNLSVKMQPVDVRCP